MQNYRFQILTVEKLPSEMYSAITLFDHANQESFQLAAKDIISNKELLKEINPNFISVICSAAVEDGVKYELWLKANLTQYNATAFKNAD